MRAATIALDIVLAAIGLGAFIYGELATNRIVRIVGVVFVTVAIIWAAIITVTREQEP
jgi:hypothetical protein